jgi:hypothetical protein
VHLGHDDVGGLLRRVVGEAQACADFVRHPFADEELARTRGGDGAGAVVGIGAGADDGRIADPAPALAGQPAGRGGGGGAAVPVDRDRADRAVFEVDVERLGIGALAEFLELTAALGDVKPLVGDLLQPILLRELIGAEAAQEDVRALFHHRAGEADRVARVRRPRHRAGPTSRAFHDRRVMFDPALVSEDGAAAGVEMRVVLQDPDRRLDRLQSEPPPSSRAPPPPAPGAARPGCPHPARRSACPAR